MFQQQFVVQFNRSQRFDYPLGRMAVAIRIHKIIEAGAKVRRQRLPNAGHDLAARIAHINHVSRPQAPALPISYVDRLPTLTTGSLKEAASIIPLEELPTMAAACFIILKYPCVPRLTKVRARLLLATYSPIN